MSVVHRAGFARLAWTGTLALALLALAGIPRAAGIPRGGAPAAPRPAVELIQTVPVETPLGNPDLRAALDVWLEEINGARRSLDFEEFYCVNWPGEPLVPVLDAIGRAARRGVKVRLLLDSGFHKTYPMPADSLGRLPNVQVRTIDFGKLAGGVQHSKYFLVDGRVTILGSQNMDWRSLKHIHEMGVCLRDTALTRVFQSVYELDWKLAGDPSHAAALVAESATRWNPPYRVTGPGGETVEVWPSATPRGWLPDSTKWDEDAVVRRLDEARSEVAIQMYEFSPRARGRFDDAVDEALRRAAARGVRVKLALSNWHLGHPDIDFARSLAAWPNIEVRIVNIPEWSGGYIPFARVDHSKYMVVDSVWTCVGTDNWTPDYFLGSRNVSVAMKGRALALQALRSIQATWSSALAEPLKMVGDYPPGVHGATPPEGKKAYGN